MDLDSIFSTGCGYYFVPFALQYLCEQISYHGFIVYNQNARHLFVFPFFK